jgi:tetratricopeptide (TPR) repeat protein
MRFDMPTCYIYGGVISQHEKSSSFCSSIKDEYQPLAEHVQQAMDEAPHTYRSGKYVLAAQACQEVIELDPEIFIASFFLLDSLISLGKAHEAKQAMQTAAAMHPGSAPVFYNLGYLNECLSDFTGARAAYEQALKPARSDANVHNNKDFIKGNKKQMKAVKKRC